MSPSVAKESFPFIVSSGPKLQTDPAVRTLIRKQAMKDVANARKKRGNYGRVNMRQLPIFEETNVPIRASVDGSDKSSSRESSETLDFDSSPENATDSSRSSNEEACEGFDELVPRYRVPAKRKAPFGVTRAHDNLSLAAISLFSSYETARSKFRVDVTDLSILTNFNIGKSTIPILSADPSRLASLMGYQQWSYLQFVPSRYGFTECLTAATNCVLAKVHSILAPQDGSSQVVLQLYTKALRTLQDAISAESTCLEADVLCATQLLSLHELLDGSRDTAWSHHIDGSTHLVKSRTPKRFTTEFEKALFAAHAGPVLSEALLGNVHCYLEQPEWRKLYLSLAQESDYLNERSPLAIHMRALMFPVPGLWHDIHEALTGPALFEDDMLAVLEKLCRSAHRDMLSWMEEYKAHCVKMSLTSPPPHELAMRRELFGAALECLTIVKRLLACVCDDEREKLETEAQAIAHLILDLQKQPSPKHSWLFSGHEVGVAYTVMLTKDQWEGHFEYESDFERKMAIRTRYNTWSNTLRMTA